MRIGQSRKVSFLESFLNILIGISVAFAANAYFLPLFGFSISIEQNLYLTIIYTCISFIRSYFVRRFFNKLHLMDIL